MVTNKDTIWSRIVALVEKLPTKGFSRVMGSQELTRNTDLVSDLGLTGDDAFEFMEQYATLFAVKKGDYDSTNYFEAEGLWLLPRLRKQKPKMRITLGMLEAAAREGEWNSAKLNQVSSESSGKAGG
ncbi:uncharacterized protein sS8_5093 [Methylocaldum marinum]|uniref:DUF1493 family protein n=1 Tax=Methylocaldum marinum TaxID=1432792 RepID=A0A250KZS3_9GAMM|nr:DUF1493 family protein [Methylocaldum marinum]BBA37016.1 uncharacterized protein sS8_5093 [Methylocaldum marinum]